ncbi:thymidine kinase [Geobacillus phage GR1]|nr:thymidine kinase [Geobacillus phage GR1]
MVATFTTGLMGSGKSKSLIKKIKKDNDLCIALSAKLQEETGTIGKIESRNGQFIYSININANEHEKVTKFIKTLFSVQELKTVYIDEVQFLSKTTLSEILNEAIKNEIEIHFYGLSTTFTGDYFEGSRYLLREIEPMNIFNIPMNCQYEKCNSLAEYNARIVNGKVVRNGDTFVEEKSKYLAYCKKHYFS